MHFLLWDKSKPRLDFVLHASAAQLDKFPELRSCSSNFIMLTCLLSFCFMSFKNENDSCFFMYMSHYSINYSLEKERFHMTLCISVKN